MCAAWNGSAINRRALFLSTFCSIILASCKVPILSTLRVFSLAYEIIDCAERIKMQAPGRTPYRTDPMRAAAATTPSHIRSQHQSQTPTTRSPLRRRPLACVRCRRRKVRCDGAAPACSNCAKAGEECFEGRAASAVSKRFVTWQRRETRF